MLGGNRNAPKFRQAAYVSFGFLHVRPPRKHGLTLPCAFAYANGAIRYAGYGFLIYLTAAPEIGRVSE